VLERRPATASLVVRHVGAYGDFIAEDAGFAYAAFLQRFWSSVIFVAAAVLSIAMACVWAIALTWDTAGRMRLIAGVFGLFVLTSVVALIVLRALRNNQQGLPAGFARKERLGMGEGPYAAR
jgi:ABC-type sugar transport system permease subunit